MNRAVAFVLLGLMSLWAHGAVPTIAVGDEPQLSLGEEAGFFLDHGQKWQAQQLLHHPGAVQWQKEHEKVPNFGLIPDNLWVAFRIDNTLDQAQSRMLELGYPMLDKVDVYIQRNDQPVTAYHTGDRRPFATRPVVHRNFVFRIDLKPRESALVLMRIETEGALQVPLTLWEVQDFFTADMLPHALQITFTGIMLALAIYNFLLFISVRSISFLWYVGNAVFVSLALLTIRGITFQYLWPDSPWLNNAGLPAMIALDALFICLFSHSFLNARRNSLLISRGLRMVAAGSLILALYSLQGDYDLSIKLAIGLVSVGAPLLLGIGVYLWRKGEPLARFFTLAWAAMLAGHTVLALNKLGVLPSNDLLEYAPQVGAVVEMLLLSFALGHRINLERKRRFAAQADALRIQREANERLEEKVAERTRALEDANNKLRELSALDGLTQVKNRLWFDEAIASEWRRSCRDISSMALMMLDVDHFKRINDTYGHQCGDACLQHMANLVRDLARREGDDVARYGGEEFVILLPQTSLAGCLDLAETIRQAVAAEPVQWQGQAIAMTVSIGVAGCVPAPDRNFADLVQAADKALYEAKNSGRNRVVAADPEQQEECVASME